MNQRALLIGLVGLVVVLGSSTGQAQAQATPATTTSSTTAAPVAAGSLVVTGAWVRQPAPGARHLGGFMRVRNGGTADVAIVGVSSSLSPRTELHTHLHEHGVMKMRQVPAIAVKAGSEVSLQPGGLHVMFMDVARHPAIGDVVELTLKLQDGGLVTVKVPVLASAPAVPAVPVVPAPR